MIYRGWNAKIYIGGVEVGCASDFEIEIDHNLEPYFPAGQRTAIYLREKEMNITGRIERALVDTTYLMLLCTTLALSTFDLEFKVFDPGMDQPKWTVKLIGCKVSKGSITVPADGIIEHELSFVARRIQLS